MIPKKLREKDIKTQKNKNEIINEKYTIIPNLKKLF